MINKSIFILFSLFFFNLNAQDFGLGLLLDSELYKNAPTAAPLMRGDYDNLPSSASIKEYTPTPGNQGSSSTCAGWATAYAGRTILEAQKNRWARNKIDSNSYSPSYVYNQIRVNDNCNSGTSLVDALDVLKDIGALKMKDFGYVCNKDVTDNDIEKSKEHRIIEYRDITPSLVGDRIKYIKKSLAEQHPVIIAFDCAPSFMRAGELWTPDSSEYKNWGQGHAMVVVGYDDNKFGGGFELLNSWGKYWGKEGYAWISYSDFDFFCHYAFEIIDRTLEAPDKVDLSGALTFREDNGDLMKAKFNGSYFEMEKPYVSGALFELRISNNEPAYVYAFSSDLTNKTYKIFPFTKRMVAYLPYKQNNIAIPDEDSYNVLDETIGKSYYCFLYSRKKLDIDEIITSVEKSKGSMWERVKAALSNDIVENAHIEFSTAENISFKGKSGGRSVIPVLVEINHTN